MAELIYTRSYYPGILAERVINVVVGIIELLLAVRLVLELLGANSSSAFIAWIYNASYGLVSPFMGAFPSLSLGTGSVIDLSTVLAMIVYAVIGWIVIRLLSFIFVSVA